MTRYRDKETLAKLIEGVRKGLSDGVARHALADQLGITYDYITAIIANYKLAKPIAKTEGLNWVHPPHIPFLPCR